MGTTIKADNAAPGSESTFRYLEHDPLSCYKQLSIKNRRIKAWTIYGDFIRDDEPMTAEEIAADRELPLEAVLEAIAYCRTNPPEIEADLRRQRALAEATGTNDPSRKLRPSKLLSAQELARIFEE